MKQPITIRVASEQDAEELLNIYAPYVKNTAITFEYEVPSIEEFQGRIKKIEKQYPYLVAEKDGEIVGFVYANTFHERAAYDEYLSKDSVKFHEKLGYRFVGEFYKCGYKFNRWYNMVWMEKHIGEHEQNPNKVQWFEEVRHELEE